MLYRTLFAAFAVLIASAHVRADNFASVTSSQGYTITVVVRYTGITLVSQSNNCKYGFNYVQNYDYEVTYSGGGGPRTYYLGIGGGCVTNGGTVGIPESSSLSGSIQSYNKYSNTSTQCQKIDPADYACEMMNLTVSAPGIPEQTVTMHYMESNAVLPVFLSDFGAEADASGVNVHWETQAQDDQEYFTVERSANGVDWEPLVSLQKHTGYNLFQGYTFHDDHPLASVNYYRVVAVAMDGSSTISEVAAVNASSHHVSIQPNPATDVLYLRGFEELQVFDMQGRDVTAVLTSQRTGDGSFTVDISRLQKGLYFVRSSTGTQRFQRI